MIIFIKTGSVNEEELRHLREYMDENNLGIVTIVHSLDDIQTERS